MIFIVIVCRRNLEGAYHLGHWEQRKDMCGKYASPRLSVIMIIPRQIVDTLAFLFYKCPTLETRNMLERQRGKGKRPVLCGSHLFISLGILSNTGRTCLRYPATANSVLRIAAAVWSSFAPLSLFRNVRCLSDMERARELLGLRKSIARLQDARMHMSLSSILGTDLHLIKPLQALALMCVWNEVTMKLEGFYVLTGSCCSLHYVLLVSEHENVRAH